MVAHSNPIQKAQTCHLIECMLLMDEIHGYECDDESMYKNVELIFWSIYRLILFEDESEYVEMTWLWCVEFMNC